MFDDHFILNVSRLLDNKGNVKFTCRVIHSLPLMMSAVQVFHLDKMVAVSHLIGTEQLPTPVRSKEIERHPMTVGCRLIKGTQLKN